MVGRNTEPPEVDSDVIASEMIGHTKKIPR